MPGALVLGCAKTRRSTPVPSIETNASPRRICATTPTSRLWTACPRAQLCPSCCHSLCGVAASRSLLGAGTALLWQVWYVSRYCSTNFAPPAAPSMGESSHNFHHAQPAPGRHGLDTESAHPTLSPVSEREVRRKPEPLHVIDAAEARQVDLTRAEHGQPVR
jgi:hypothetical protein